MFKLESKTITAKLHDPGKSGRIIQVTIELAGDPRRPNAIYIKPEGYGEPGAMDGCGSPVCLEIWDGKLQVIVNPDISDENKLVAIPLEAARESLRKDEDSLPRITAYFRPQAWVGDQAVDLDEGKAEWDCTSQILALPAQKIVLFKEGNYDTDNLAIEAGVRGDHDGPFEVDLEPSLDEFLEAVGLNRTLLTQEQWDKLGAKYSPCFTGSSENETATVD